MNRRDDDPEDEFFAPVLREPPPPEDITSSGVVSDTGVPDVHGGGHGEWPQAPPPSSWLGVRLLAAALGLLVGVVLTVLALLAARPLLAVPPALVALGAAVYLVTFSVRRSHADGGPPTFG